MLKDEIEQMKRKDTELEYRQGGVQILRTDSIMGSTGRVGKTIFRRAGNRKL